MYLHFMSFFLFSFFVAVKLAGSAVVIVGVFPVLRFAVGFVKAQLEDII